ncbi:MAG: hypothetical protein BGO98_02330 [Myxococcales bacterium 68-20]|nr:hypothetical protein [Myxococcales bacterium]OJY21685.1 MAG: hypothetical protein BGO98_02330 [Myxococcales bacterium 68-20]
MSRAFVVAIASLVAAPLLVQGCGDSVEVRSALEEPVRVGYFIGSSSFSAQFFPGDLPEPADGPAIAGVDIGPLQVAPGKTGKDGYTVRLARDAYSVAVRVKGRTNGYWIARVDQVEPLFEGQVSASLYFDVALSVPTGVLQLELAGVTKDRRFGPRSTAPLAVVPRIPSNVPAAIHLRWDSPVDLDLQVRSPDGTMLTPKHPTTAPADMPDAGNAPGIGYLDGDSMASCTEDGLREENVLFQTPPLPGKYQVYVNAFDLCQRLGTNYEVSVIRNGNVEQRFFGRISDAEVQRGGFALGDFVTDVTF